MEDNLTCYMPTPVFLPGESHGRRSLVGYSPRGRKESDMTERLYLCPLKYLNLGAPGGLEWNLSHITKIYGLPRWLSGKESACQAWDLGSIPGSEDPLEKEMSNHSSILGTSLVAQVVRNLPAMQETQVWSLEKIPWRRQWLPLQYSCLENPMDREAWWATVHGVAQSWTWLKASFNVDSATDLWSLHFSLVKSAAGRWQWKSTSFSP